MPYGWMGICLEIDLSSGVIEKIETDPTFIRSYLGGKGINARILWERVPTETDAFSPDNLLAITPGLLTGSLVPGACQTNIAYKSPVTGIFCYSGNGGFIGTEIKHAGYDSIIIRGKATAPVYLWINNDEVELRDAAHLFGKSPAETTERLREALNNKNIQTLVIGPAGEKRVFFASIEHGNGSSASRGGAGAVMGDKNLKAIAVRGTKDIHMPGIDLTLLCETVLDKASRGNRARIIERAGYSYVRAGLRASDFGNFSGVKSPELQQQIHDVAKKATDYIRTSRKREVSCYNCAMRCKHEYGNSTDGYSFNKCAMFYPMTATQIIDVDFVVKFAALCSKYGMDYKGSGHAIAIAIDLFQKGILTEADTGIKLEWKNPEAAFYLLEKIAKREGIGDVLANGTHRAARQIGRGAEQYVYTAKKLDLPQFGDYHHLNVAATAALSDKGCTTKNNSSSLNIVVRRPKEERETFLKEGWFAYPEELEKYVHEGIIDNSEAEVEGICRFNIYNLEQFALADATGVCAYWLHYWMYPPMNRAQLASFISGVTGMEMDEAELTQIARRIINQVRAYNVREGMRKKDDFGAVPRIAFERKQVLPEKPLSPEVLDKLITRYYELRGWDTEGIPKPETLTELGLDDVRDELVRRGIIKG